MRWSLKIIVAWWMCWIAFGFVLGLGGPLLVLGLLAVVVACGGVVVAVPLVARQLNYRRRWLQAVELLTASDEARDQAFMRGAEVADMASARQRRVRELEAEVDGWRAAADGANDALAEIRSSAWAAGWDAHAAAQREEQGRQRALEVRDELRRRGGGA